MFKQMVLKQPLCFSAVMSVLYQEQITASGNVSDLYSGGTLLSVGTRLVLMKFVFVLNRLRKFRCSNFNETTTTSLLNPTNSLCNIFWLFGVIEWRSLTTWFY